MGSPSIISTILITLFSRVIWQPLKHLTCIRKNDNIGKTILLLESVRKTIMGPYSTKIKIPKIWTWSWNNIHMYARVSWNGQVSCGVGSGVGLTRFFFTNSQDGATCSLAPKYPYNPVWPTKQVNNVLHDLIFSQHRNKSP